jgi:hypothetical protein
VRDVRRSEEKYSAEFIRDEPAGRPVRLRRSRSSEFDYV